MSHASAMVCIQVPTNEINCPPKNRRKLRCFSDRNTAGRRLCPEGPGVRVFVGCTSSAVGIKPAIYYEFLDPPYLKQVRHIPVAQASACVVLILARAEKAFRLRSALREAA